MISIIATAVGILLTVIISYYFHRCSHILPKLYYINLRNRKDRQTHILGQLAKVDYPQSQIHRVDAIKHEDGATGCGLSHIKALELAQRTQKNDNDYVIVLEDDFTWIHNKEKTLQLLNHALQRKEWNVILLACNGTWDRNPLNWLCRHNRHTSKVHDCQTTSGYIIKVGYIPNLLKIWKRDMLYRQSSKKYTHETCIDISWKQLQHEDWYITNPKLGVQIESYSDIAKQNVNYHV